MDRASLDRARRIPVLVAALVMALALLTGACAKSDDNAESPTTPPPDNQLEPEEAPHAGGKIVMGLTAETNGWNPGTNQWADAGEMAGSTFMEPLMVFDKNGVPVPYLAESVTPTVDGRFDRWTIKIKPDISFHNGEPLNAQVVARNLNFYAKEALLSSLAQRELVDVATVVDDSTVEIKLNIQWAAYPGVLAGPSGFMMANAMLDAEDKGSSAPIGTGPFVFSSWTPGSRLIVKKNPNYWQAGKPYLDEIEFRPIPEAKQRANALESGDVDMILTTRAEDVANLKDDYTIVKDWSAEKTFVMLNVLEDPTKTRNPFKNVHARRALAYAANPKEIIETIGYGEAMTTSTSPLVGNYRLDPAETGWAYSYNPEKAKEEIELYKQDTGYDDFAFTFSGLGTLEDRQIMELLERQWEEVGMKVTIDTREQTAYIGQLVAGGFQAAYFRNYAYKDPDSNYVFWSCDTAKGLGLISINFSQYCSPEIDALLKIGRENPNVEDRRAAYKQLTQLRNEATIDIWLFDTPYSVIADKNIRGLNPLRENGFGDFLPKPWMWTSIWKKR